MSKFQPIILGSDINAYGMARSFHEAYSIKSIAFAHFQLSPTKFSRIVDVRVVEHFGRPDIFVQTLIDFAQDFQTQHSDTTLLLVPCGDSYANLLAGASEKLRPYYAFHALSQDLNRKLSLKSSFYQLCEQYHLPYPKTKTIDADGVKRGEYKDLPFNYPVAMKAADSDAWLSIDFPGRKKAFIFDNPEELETMIVRSYNAGYQGTMVIQDFIPGDDSHMRVLNAYVDQHHNVRMMFLGHPLLEDPTPEAVGNYAAIIPDYNEEIFSSIKNFLESIHYHGVANFDMKYDERDGKYKLFEINLRQGRSSYFVTLNGANLAKYFVEDLVENTPHNGETEYARGNKLWMEIPKSIFRDYVEAGEDKTLGMKMIRRGDWGTTLEYNRDRSPLRWLMIQHMFNIYKKRYRQFFSRKGEL